MAILGLQGVRGGVGTTSVTAALAWSLQQLGESVIVVDACADNLLRLAFNDDFSRRDGWARAWLDNIDWRDAGMRYTADIDFLSFGQLTPLEQQQIHTTGSQPSVAADIVRNLQQQGQHQWVLVDIPHGVTPYTQGLIEACQHVLTVVNLDLNCHVRLHQQALPVRSHILINDLRIGSQIQDDLFQVWLQSQRRLLPVAIHRDEALAESLAAKQPLGEYRPDSLAAEELLTLAGWCLMHYASLQDSAESAS